MMEELGFIPVAPEDSIPFSCSMCSSCCRNVNASVAIETLDLFRLARFLNICMDEAISEYVDVWPLNENGYPALFLKTTGSDNSCVFLKNNRCSVNDAKPRACRLFPFGAVPGNEAGYFQYFLVSKDQHHYKGPRIRIKDWMDRYFTDEDRRFLQLDISSAIEINRLMRKIPDTHAKEMLLSLMLLKFTLFDRNAEFMPQFISNMALLKRELKNLIGEESI